jgi:tetratricopeptide (TPR) repeat protein
MFLRKYLWFLVPVVVFAGLFVYSQVDFRKEPPLEEKFVVEEDLPGPASSPSTSVSPERLDLSEARNFQVNLAQPGSSALLPGTKVSYQTFNNCGPANMAMILSYYGIEKTQKEMGELMRPYQHPKGDNDDKTVTPEEFVYWAQQNGLEALTRPTGSIELLKMFLANEVPVVVKTLLKPTEDSAHFRVVRGFDEEKQVIIVDDSYFGPNTKVGYFDFLQMWQPFNYGYILVYRADKSEIVKVILGDEIDEQVAYWRAINRAQKEIEKDPENVWPAFNKVNSLYHVGEYQKCVTEFEQIESRLSKRALWYQIEPILAYQKLGNYDRVFEIINRVLTNDNLAFSELYQIRGEIYLDQGNVEAARQEFEQALKYNYNFLPAKEALSRL